MKKGLKMTMVEAWTNEEEIMFFESERSAKHLKFFGFI